MDSVADGKDYTYTLEDHAQRHKDTHFDAPLLNAIVARFKPTSLIDLGCGTGWYCEAAAKAGVKTVLGVEKTPDIGKLAVFAPITVWDLSTPLWPLPSHFDVALCLEVAQYTSPERASFVVQNCCRAGRRVVFSAAPPGQPQPHFGAANAQLKPYWIEQFSAAGYAEDSGASAALRSAARLPHLQVNVMVFQPNA